MSRLHLRRADSDDNTHDQRDVLPFPVGWRDGGREREAVADELRDAAETAAEIESALEEMQQEIDALREEIDDALHLPAEQSWRPPAA